MNIIFKHILRNLNEHKVRSFLIFFALLVSTSVFVISITISDDLVLKIEDTFRSVYGKADIRLATVEPFKLEDLNIDSTEINYIGMSHVEGINGNNKSISITGFDINKAKSLKLLGNDVPTLKLNEIIINKKTADEKNYHKSDIISFKYNDKVYNLTIKAIVDNKGVASLKKDYDLFFTSSETINNIKNYQEDYYDSIYINVVDDIKITNLVEYLKDNNENYSIIRLVDSDSIKETISMISTIMYLIVLMATIMIYFVINSLNKIILAERIPVIGTFRSIGASRWKMNFILLLENALYGISAGVVGSIIGTYLNSLCSNAFVSTSGVELSTKSLSLSPTILMSGVLFATLLQIFITIKEIIRTNKKPIKTLIFNTQNSRYRLRKMRTVVGFILLIISLLVFLLLKRSSILSTGICLIFFMVGIANTLPVFIRVISKMLTKLFKKIGFTTGIIASKNIGYNKMIIASSRLIIIAISLLSSIILMSNAITRAFSNFRVTTKDIDIIVEGINHNNEHYEYLKDIDGIEKVQYVNSYFPMDATYNDNQKFFLTLGLYAENERRDAFIKELDYKIADLKDNEILVDEQYAYKNKFEVGDSITINYNSINKSYRYKIVGLIDSSNFNIARNMIVVSYNHLINDINGVPMQINIKCSKGTDVSKMKEIVEDSIKEVGIKMYTTEEYITEQEEQISSITNIVYLVIGISVALSFIGIINNQIIGFINRKKELAILNSTCMNKIQIKKMIALETIIANLISLVIAVLVSAVTVIFVNIFLNNVGFYLNIRFEFDVIIKFVVLVYVILLLTLFVPFRKLKKMNIVEEIKYE